MSIAPLVVFVMGLRHGADPDHLAAIDNLTRSASERMPRESRFIGALFAVGHSGMVLGTATLAAAFGSKVAHASHAMEEASAIASIVILLLIVALNVAALAHGNTAGSRGRFLPKPLREATHPLAAIPIGALFGVGFETSSQLVAYGIAFSSAHLLDGVSIGVAFCLGMICTDTFDSFFVARLVAAKKVDVSRARRPWIVVVTLIALAVAAERAAEYLGYAPPIDELMLSGTTVLVLIVTAFIVLVRTRAAQKRPT